jgi:outer membrane protein assembly factor BamB
VLRNVTPVAFTYKQKKLLIAPGKDGSLILLDGEAPGGADHHTVLAETSALGTSKSETPDALAVWQDATGVVWIFASIQGPVSAKFATSDGSAIHGSVAAFKLEEDGGKMSLAPQWISHDMVSPAPPVIANGLVIALAQGSASTRAKLLVLDAATGKELYSSGDAIETYACMAGVSVGDGHVFFVTHDNTLYSFGIGIEH